jgi:ligand-binding sensor domain-containing protein
MKSTQPLRGLVVIVLIVVSSSAAYASQDHTKVAPAAATDDWNWANYTNPNHVRSLAWEWGSDTIWTGTTGGAVRWNTLDGSYRLYTTADGLAGNFVAHTAVDGSRNKWFDTAHGGIYGGDSPGSYGVSQFKDTQWTTHGDWPSGCEPHNVTDFAVDSSGNLWAGTRVSGTYKYDGSTWSAVTQADGLASNTVLAIALGVEDPTPHLWFATNAGISEFDPQGWTTYSYSNDARDIAVDGESVWVATSTGAGRLIITDETYTKFDTDDGLISDDINTVALDWEGRIWFGSDAGVSVYDQASWTNYTASDGLSPGPVWSITVDGRGHVWLGTSTGLTEYDGDNWTVHQVTRAPSSNYVDALLPEGQNAFWAGSGASWEPCGIDHFDGSTWTNYDTSHGLPHANVDAIAKDNDGHLWVGTQAGIAEYDGSLWTTHTVASVGNQIRDIAVDAASGHLWFATNDGAAEYDGSMWNTYKTADGLVSNDVTAIAVDKLNSVWFGTDSGVSFLDGSTWATFKQSDGLVSNTIVDITVDNLNRIWFATSSGLSRYADGSWDTFTKADSSLASNVVQSIAADRRGRIWIGTQAGANRYDQGTWSTFSCKDGLADEDVHTVAIGSDGRIWFGTDSGVTRLTLPFKVYLPLVMRQH